MNQKEGVRQKSDKQIMDENLDTVGKQMLSRAKIVHIWDSKQFSFKILLSTNYFSSFLMGQLQNNHYFVQKIVPQSYEEDVTKLQSTYRKTCLIVSDWLYNKYLAALAQSYYIQHILIVAEPKMHQIDIQLNQAVCVQRSQIQHMLIKEKIAWNFLQHSQQCQFEDIIRLQLQQKQFTQQQIQKFVSYLRLIGRKDEEVTDIKMNHIPKDSQSFLRFYSSRTECYFANILLRRFHQPPLLSLISFVVSGLHNAIQKGPKLRGPRVCYRGGSISEDEVDYLKSKINMKVKCRYFMSCTLNQSQADSFRENCIFQIHFQDGPHAFLGYLSEYEEQQQVLFDILAAFMVIDVTQDKSRVNKSWKVVLKHHP